MSALGRSSAAVRLGDDMAEKNEKMEPPPRSARVGPTLFVKSAAVTEMQTSFKEIEKNTQPGQAPSLDAIKAERARIDRKLAPMYIKRMYQGINGISLGADAASIEALQYVSWVWLVVVEYKTWDVIAHKDALKYESIIEEEGGFKDAAAYETFKQRVTAAFDKKTYRLV